MKRNKSFDQSKPLFYLIATPIGNREDISLRALKILDAADFVAAEDTRNALKLLSMYDLAKPLISVHEHNEVSASLDVINKINAGELGVFISDAGYPGISDPGEKLVQILLENNVAVSVIPGPAAFLSGLVGSGLSTEHFYFHGFLSPKKSARISELEMLLSKTETLIFYEAPHRIKETLTDLAAVFGPRKSVLARELTKLHEEYLFGTLEELAQLDPTTLKGEMVIIVEGGNRDELQTMNDDKLLASLDELISFGVSTKDAIRFLANEHHIAKNYLSDLFYNRS